MYNLGLINVVGVLNTEILFNIIKTHLIKFKINIDSDIISIITDGCSLMAALKKFFNGPQILWFTHFLNLIVSKTLFKTKINKKK